MVTVSPAGSGAGRKILRRLERRPAAAIHCFICAWLNPSLPMRLAFAQVLELVRREIDDQKTPAGGERRRRFANRATRFIEKVQHLVDDDEIEAVANDRQVHHVAEPDARMVDRRALEIGARHREHRRRQIDAERTLVAAGEELQHAAGAGADVEHRAVRTWTGAKQHRRFYLPLGNMQRADLIPAAGVLGEILFGHLAVLLLQCRRAARGRVVGACRRGRGP